MHILTGVYMKIIRLLTAGALALVMGSAQAELFDRGGGLIYDSTQNITWLQDANYGNQFMTWSAAMDWAQNLNYLDTVRNVTYSDWRLPNIWYPEFPSGNPSWFGHCFGYNCTNSEMGILYYLELGRPAMPVNTLPNPELFKNVLNTAYWTSTSYWPTDGRSWIFNMGDGGQVALTQEQYHYAWAVRDGDVASVPEPETYAMLLAGIALIGVALRRNNRS